MKKVVKPYGAQNQSKKEEVATMFNNISSRYDFLNHFLSLGIDKFWRRKAVKQLKKINPDKILDIATGTGDFALALLKLKPKEIVGVDISEGMLSVGNLKMKRKKVDNIIKLLVGDSESLPFDDNSFDAITVAFGVRNFENLQKGLQEMRRVLKPDGKVVILEFSKPKKFPIKQLFAFYSGCVIPFFGRLISKDKRAYSYLPESVEQFPEGQDFHNQMDFAEFVDISSIRLSGGISSIYMGHKKM